MHVIGKYRQAVSVHVLDRFLSSSCRCFPKNRSKHRMHVTHDSLVSLLVSRAVFHEGLTDPETQEKKERKGAQGLTVRPNGSWLVKASCARFLQQKMEKEIVGNLW